MPLTQLHHLPTASLKCIPASQRTPLHLIVPYALDADSVCGHVTSTLVLSHLDILLNHPRARAPQWVPNPAKSLHMPHEWLMANATGLATDAEQIAWAAWQAQSDEPCAWFTLCHLNIGIDQVSLQMSDDLCIAPEHDQALLIAMQSLAANDGIALTSIGPGRWLAKGLPLADLATASIDRVANQALTAWLPTGTHANTLRRLQSEAQMLFYTHPAQDERQAQGLPSINSFWISGSGTTPQHARQMLPPQHLHVETTLRLPALKTDWLAWQTAWQQFDESSLAQCTARVNQGQGMQLSLCGRHGHFDIAIDAHPKHMLTHVANGYQYLMRKLTKPMSLHTLWQTESKAAQ